MPTDSSAALWADVDSLLASTLLHEPPEIAAAADRAAAAGLPAIAVSPAQGKFLELLVRLTRPARVLELGTLAGYSTLWLARALPPAAHLTTLELNPDHAAVARANFAAAHHADRITVLVGPALDLLPTLTPPFDLIFIDADKPSSPAYLHHALRLAAPGALIILDNVIRDGSVLNPADDASRGVREALRLIGSHPRLAATALQTVGLKGYDGFALAVVLPTA